MISEYFEQVRHQFDLNSDTLLRTKRSDHGSNGLLKKVIAVAYDRWSITRASNSNDLGGMLPLFWICRLWEVWSVTRDGRTLEV